MNEEEVRRSGVRRSGVRRSGEVSGGDSPSGASHQKAAQSWRWGNPFINREADVLRNLAKQVRRQVASLVNKEPSSHVRRRAGTACALQTGVLRRNRVSPEVGRLPAASGQVCGPSSAHRDRLCTNELAFEFRLAILQQHFDDLFQILM